MLTLAFLWHMHQPWYGDPAAKRFILPWVRLHGLKDYLDMGLLLTEFPKIRAVFNFTPCLLEQLALYAQGVEDEHQRLSFKKIEELSAEEAARLVAIGFSGIPEKRIIPYPRYHELFLKMKKKERFFPQDLQDLAVWSNLTWIDPRWRREDPFLKSLFLKGSQFTQEEKMNLLRAEMALLQKIVPVYRDLERKGQVELTTSPWGHPILPLLHQYGLSEDVAWHLKEAVSQHERFFGSRPQGLWPSEGAVSREILPPVAASGVRWFATDEEILWKSFGSPRSRSCLYRPYRLKTPSGNLSILFRDHVLSDLIGFVYSSWPARQAVNDFIKRLMEIEKGSRSAEEPPIVLVALDGENAWESYPEDGEPFLRELYEELSGSHAITCVSVSEYLKAHPPKEELTALASGSWIRGDFSTWAGQPAHTQAWDILRGARRLKGPHESRSMSVAQGSDWFWWLGPEHNSPQDTIFDELFRSHLKQVYREANETPPQTLDEPIKKGNVLSPFTGPTGFVTPVVDGEISSYFEWLQAGEVDLSAGAAMARSKPCFSRFLWGCDREHLSFRLDPGASLAGRSLTLLFQGDRFEILLELKEGLLEGGWFRVESGKRIGPKEKLSCAFSKVVEISLPLAVAGLTLGGKLTLIISIHEEGFFLERYPVHGSFSLELPAAHTQTYGWSA